MPVDGTSVPGEIAERARSHGFDQLHAPVGRDEFVETVQGLAAQRSPIVPIGAGSRLAWGAALAGHEAVLSAARLDRITRFAPDDLTCGVEPGVRWSVLEEELAGAGLTLDPGPFPACGERTLGGLLAEAPPSPRGYDRGSWRSQLIGVTGVDGRGRVLRAGGNVVKNVAGYDLCKLFVGSGGAFFVAVELQLRLTALPEAARWLASPALPAGEAGRLWLRMRDRAADARAVDLALAGNGSARVEVLLAGAAPLVEAGQKELGLEVAGAGEDAWRHLPSQSVPADTDTVVRGRILPTRVPELAATLSACAGRVHAGGAFSLHGPAIDPEHFHAEDVVRCIRNGVASASAATIVRRIKDVFGGTLCPTRASFDTTLPSSR